MFRNIQFVQLVLLLSQSWYSSGTWRLAMNLDPNDGHTMHYCTGWHEDIQHGDSSNAFVSDYICKDVRHLPINYIAICRHYNGEIQALKIWRFKEPNRSLLSRFQDMDPGRVNATDNQIYAYITGSDPPYDPIFSNEGALVFNWVYGNNGIRIANTGTRLSAVHDNDDNTHGLGGHFDVQNLRLCEGVSSVWGHEVGIKYKHYVLGTDHGTGSVS